MRVLVPTRDRPANARRIIESFYDTKTLKNTSIFLVLDSDSPKVGQYRKMVDELDIPVGSYYTTGNMVQRTNIAAHAAAMADGIIGWAADDNVFVTNGWDKMVTDEFLASPEVGLVDTNDLLVTAEDNKTGAFFVRGECVRGLGYLYLPECEHLYVDRAAAVLYKKARAYTRREDIVIEHVHPYASKAQWDEHYAKYNNQSQDDKDGTAYENWIMGKGSTSLHNDAQRIKTCLRKPAF